MHISTLSFLSFAAAVSAKVLHDNITATYAITDGGWYMGVDQKDIGGNFTLCVENKTGEATEGVDVDSKTTALILNDLFTPPMHFNAEKGINMTLGSTSVRQFTSDFSHWDTPTPGFSWSENMTLQWDYDGFYGWVQCANSTLLPPTLYDYNVQGLYWATSPIKDLPSYCGEVTFNRISVTYTLSY